MTNLITFSGLDGAGKTTQISLLVEHLERQKTSFRLLTMYDDISVAARARRFFEKRRSPTGPTPKRSEAPGASTGGTDKVANLRLDKNRSDLPTVVARELVYLLDLTHFVYVRSRCSLDPNGVLVMDRYFYDSLANLLSATKLSAPYVSLFLKLAPVPQMAALLDLEPETACRRKLEYPLDYLRKRRIAYHRIFSQVDTALILDAEQEPELVHRQIVEQAEAKMSLSQEGG